MSLSRFTALNLVRPRVQFPAPDTYPGALQAKLAALYTAQFPQVTNGGRPGETVTGPATFPRFVSFTSTGAYDAVLLMEGVNDLGSHSIPEIIAGLARMVDDAKSRGMKVFLATLPPQNPNGFDPVDRGTQYEAVPPFNDSIKGLAASKGVQLVDVYQAFGLDLTLISNDGLHQTAAGYHTIANAFLASIRQTLELPAAASSIAKGRWGRSGRQGRSGEAGGAGQEDEAGRRVQTSPMAQASQTRPSGMRLARPVNPIFIPRFQLAVGSACLRIAFSSARKSVKR